jgi:hypothetical protein
VSRDNFEHYFEPREGIVFLPSSRNVLANALGFSSINYRQRLEATLQATWGEFDYWEDDHECVGEVERVEILRSTIHYTRVATTETNDE